MHLRKHYKIILKMHFMTPLIPMCDVPRTKRVNSIPTFLSLKPNKAVLFLQCETWSLWKYIGSAVHLLWSVWHVPAARVHSPANQWLTVILFKHPTLCPSSLIVLTHSADGGVSNHLSGPVYWWRCYEGGWMQADGLAGQSSSLSLCRNKTFK